MKEEQNLTWDDIKVMYAETDRRIEKTWQMLAKKNVAEARQQRKEFDQRLKKMYAESDARHEKRIKKWSENFEKEKREADQRKKESDERLAKLEKLVGGIGNSNGEMAENFFYNAFRKDKIFMDEKYDHIQKGYFSSHDPYKWEFDIIFYNGTNVAIIETKYNAKPDNIDIEILISRIGLFKRYSPAYKNHKFYLGVAAMSFKKGFASKLHKAGIVTIHPVGKKMIIYDKTVKAF